MKTDHCLFIRDNNKKQPKPKVGDVIALRNGTRNLVLSQDSFLNLSSFACWRPVDPLDKDITDIWNSLSDYYRNQPPYWTKNKQPEIKAGMVVRFLDVEKTYLLLKTICQGINYNYFLLACLDDMNDSHCWKTTESARCSYIWATLEDYYKDKLL